MKAEHARILGELVSGTPPSMCGVGEKCLIRWDREGRLSPRKRRVAVIDQVMLRLEPSRTGRWLLD